MKVGHVNIISLWSKKSIEMTRRFLRGWFSDDGESLRWLDPVGAPVLLLGALLLALVAGRGHMGLTPLSYDYGAQARGMVSGEGWGGGSWPPGYPLLMSIPMRAGCSALRSAWALSVLSYAVAAVCIYLGCRRLANHRYGALASVLFCLSPVSLKWANTATPEMAFVASTLLAMLSCDWLLFPARKRVSFLAAAVVGLIAAVPFWIRYLGIVSAGLAAAALVASMWRAPHRAVPLVSLATLAVGVVALLVRNVTDVGTLAGHSMATLPGDTFASALGKACWHVAVAYVPTLCAIQESLTKTALAGVTMTVCLALACAGLLRFRYFVISAYLPCYLLALAWCASHTRIDQMSDRFIVPVLPHLLLALVLLCHHFGRLHRIPSVARLPRFLLLFAFCVAVEYGSVAVLRGCRGLSDARYSPQTIAGIRNSVAPGTTLAVNRYGAQLRVFTSEYPTVGIPFDDPFNAYYTRALGLKLWQRKDALRVFLEKDVRLVVFFTGPDRDDPYLPVDAYGTYATQLYAGRAPEVERIEHFPDGVLIHLAEREQLIAALRGLDTPNGITHGQ
jgi:hypothetical protein